MKIGVFDSGIGGEAVAASIRKAFPEIDIVVVNDRTHMPYGDRTTPDVRNLTNAAIQPLLEQKCDVIIIACNTATALAIEWLREKYPKQLFFGLEPMVKMARNRTHTNVITICATPATLGSARYQHIKNEFASDATVIEPDCHDWARMIEDNEINEAKISEMVELCKEQNSDVIVLACTHYHWIREEIEQLAGPNVTVLDPSEAIVNRVAELLVKTK